MMTEVRCNGHYESGENHDPCGWVGSRWELKIVSVGSMSTVVCPRCGAGHILSIEPASSHTIVLAPPRPRPSWPETWMAIAHVIAARSYDPRLKVGAIIVTADNTQMLSGGYNGNYAGGPNVPESNEPGLSGFIHAEVNALVKLDFNVVKRKIMYVTHSPCRMCAKLIVNGGIRDVVYDVAYRDPSGLDLLRDAGARALSVRDAIAYEAEPI